MREKLRKFITAEIMRDSGYPLTDDEPLISSGLIDSFSLVELQIFVENEFGIRIEDTELTVDTVDCVNDLAKLVEERQ